MGILTVLSPPRPPRSALGCPDTLAQTCWLKITNLLSQDSLSSGGRVLTPQGSGEGSRHLGKEGSFLTLPAPGGARRPWSVGAPLGSPPLFSRGFLPVSASLCPVLSGGSPSLSSGLALNPGRSRLKPHLQRPYFRGPVWMEFWGDPSQPCVAPISLSARGRLPHEGPPGGVDTVPTEKA